MEQKMNTNNAEKIAGYLKERYEVKIDAHDNLYDAGVLDSMATFELVEWLESEFSIELDAEDIVEENFVSVAQIAKLVEEKTGS